MGLASAAMATVTPSLPLGPDLVVATDGSAAPAGLGGVQTPQAFRAGALLAAYTAAEADGFDGTDTAACLEAYADVTVVAVPGSSLNLKITFPEDLALAANLAGAHGEHRG